MTRFLDGPAAGVVLRLQRAPLYLRVVCDPRKPPGDRWDALDQPGDEPAPAEAMYAYRRDGDATPVHLNSRDNRGRNTSGWAMIAAYGVIEHQPPDAIMRHLASWQEWAEAQYDRDREAARA